MLLSLIYFVKVIHQREVIEFFAESAHCKGTIFVILKQRGCSLQVKVVRDQENIFRLELCVHKVYFYMTVENPVS